MKRIVALGVLTILTISCSQKVLTKPSGLNPDRAIAVLPTYSSPKRDIFYLSRQFGFRFVQPSGYVILNATKGVAEDKEELALHRYSAIFEIMK